MLDEKTYSTSKAKSLAFLLFGAAIFAIAVHRVLEAGDLTVMGGFAIAFFGAWPPVFLWLLLRPFRLKVDNEGFEVSGGMTLTPKKFGWQETGPFYVRARFHSSNWPFAPVKMIQFDLSPNYPGFGTSGGLPMAWSYSGSIEEMVDELNEFRSRVL